MTLTVLFERRCRAPATMSVEDELPPAASGSARRTLGKPIVDVHRDVRQLASRGVPWKNRETAVRVSAPGFS
jgi:hypothetical protein